MSDKPTIAITSGEPSGIGPEISLRAAWELRHEAHFVLIGDFYYFESLKEAVNNHIQLSRVDSLESIPTEKDQLSVFHIPLNKAVRPGYPDPGNALSVLAGLDVAIDGAMQHIFNAVVTAPLQKSIINDAGISFTGHTEYFAEKMHAGHVVMLLAGEISSPSNKPKTYLRVALATTHLALKDVPSAITETALESTIQILHSGLEEKFGIKNPHIFISGLNPHAGENGYLGMEEKTLITPVIQRLQEKMHLSGPFPADTLFLPGNLEQADCFLVMYHDQGLPVLKYASFGKGVNITLGLPIIRTSVDHGTALDIAKKGIGLADHHSMIEALKMAVFITKQSALL